MVEFDYCAAAELFPERRRLSGRQSFGYKRFSQASQAIRFAIEDLPPECLSLRFDGVFDQAARHVTRRIPSRMQWRRSHARD